MLDLDDNSPAERAVVAGLVERYRVLTLTEIGAIVGLSRERIRQIEFGALRKIGSLLGDAAAAELRDTLRELDARRQAHWSQVEESGDT